MRIEDRLTEHFQATAGRLEPSGRDVASIMGTSMQRQTRRKFLIGGAASVAIAGGGFMLARPLGGRSGAGRRLASNPTRIVVSPYVELEDRLERQGEDWLFTVTATAPAYWRLATLSIYEDQIWKSREHFDPTDGRLRPDLLTGSEDRFMRIEQTFQIERLKSIWLPAAAEPITIELAGNNATWQESSSTLTVANAEPSSDGLTYRVISLISSPTAAALGEVDDRDPPEVVEKYVTTTAVEAISSAADTLANSIVAGTQGRYESMLALQQHFRDNYEYTLDTGAVPVGIDAMSHFLATKLGSAQQFSGAFALMARALKIPSRVAIGFTWGDPVSTNGGPLTTYEVRDRHAHAWPEIYFGRFGWLPFEPTPGRGSPGAVGFTGVPAQQAAVPESE